MRKFETGATRDADTNKFDYEGFLSPLALERFAQYMHKNRIQEDGSTRDSDDWQKGIPLDAYMKSGFRHFFDWWKQHRGLKSPEDLEETLCAVIFNAQGYLHEIRKKRYDSFQSTGNDGSKEFYGSSEISKRASVFAGEEAKPEVGREVSFRYHVCQHDPTGEYGWCNICQKTAQVSSLGDATGDSHPEASSEGTGPYSKLYKRPGLQTNKRNCF